MVNKTSSFKKKGKGEKGNFKKNGKQVANPGKEPKARPKPETECFYCKGSGAISWACVGFSLEEERVMQQSRGDAEK